MHLPLTLSGDAERDTEAVLKGLSDGSAYCVFDSVAPAWGLRLSAAAKTVTYSLPGEGAALEAETQAWLYGSDGATELKTREGALTLPAGAYRLEAMRRGRPWIFSNAVWVD